MSLYRWLVGGITVGLLASVLLAKPGIITTKQGDTFTGDVTEDEHNVYVNGAGGQLTFNKDNIAKVEYTATVDDEYEQQHAKLKADDVKGRIALANWANLHKRSDLAVRALTEARQIDPTNNDAARALDAAQQQMELDHPTPAHPAKPAKPATAAPPPTTPATAPPSNAKPVPVQRLLTDAEVNIIRQKEMTADDPRVRIRFENGVVKKYLATGDHDAKEFNAMSPAERALAILGTGDQALAKDVLVVTDPAPLWEFKTKVLPLISNACISCHSRNRAGNFSLYPAESTNAVYTDFYILQKYSATIDKVKYLALDRDAPSHSLVLQFGLPERVGVPPHPKAPGWRPRFKDDQDPAYLTISDWLTNSLKTIKPDYGLNVAISAPTPPAKPATPATPVKPVKP